MRAVRLKIFGEGDPVKLIVGGLHGKEWRTTRKLTNSLVPSSDICGTIAIVSRVALTEEYISTLKREYYDSTAGRRLLNLIRLFKPLIYVEIHAYTKKSFNRLTDPGRLEKFNVPPFLKLPGGFLLFGSISHHLLSLYPIKVGLALELPMKKDIKLELAIARRILNVVFTSCSEDDFWTKITDLYPENSEFISYVNRMRKWLKSHV